MKKLGIIGSQSKHAEFFGSIFNIQKAFPWNAVDFIFADDEPERIPHVRETARIPNVCHSVEELIELSDAVLLTTRLAGSHFDRAMQCINHNKPVFIDKPFTLTVEEALAIKAASLENAIPVVGGSTLCFDPQLAQFIEERKSPTTGIIAYRADVDSPYGGYRFYGSHLTDLCALVFGILAVSVRVVQDKGNVTTTVNYPTGPVILHSQPGFELPEVLFEDGLSLNHIVLDDQNCYLNGMRAFVQAMEDGTPIPSHLERRIFSVQLLEAIMTSIETGDEVSVTKL